MLQITGISLDEEADLYHKAYFNCLPTNTSFALPTLGKTIYQPKKICTKCGKTGHTEDQCTCGPPSAEEIIEMMNRDLTSILYSLSLKEYKYDEHGPYKENNFEEPIQTECNFKNSIFCLNCGETGHIANACPHIRITRLISELGRYFGHDHKISGLEFHDIFQQYWWTHTSKKRDNFVYIKLTSLINWSFKIQKSTEWERLKPDQS